MITSNSRFATIGLSFSTPNRAETAFFILGVFYRLFKSFYRLGNTSLNITIRKKRIIIFSKFDSLSDAISDEVNRLGL